MPIRGRCRFPFPPIIRTGDLTKRFRRSGKMTESVALDGKIIERMGISWNVSAEAFHDFDSG